MASSAVGFGPHGSVVVSGTWLTCRSAHEGLGRFVRECHGEVEMKSEGVLWMGPLLMSAFFIAVVGGGCEGKKEEISRVVVRESAPVAVSEAPEPQPVGGPELLALVRQEGAQVTIVNVWATWCAPCVEEMPELLRLYRTYGEKGVRLLLVSADFDDAMPEVRKALRGFGVDFVTYLKSGSDEDFINALEPKWSGSLPATLVYDAAGKQVAFYEEPITFALLEGVVQKALP